MKVKYWIVVVLVYLYVGFVTTNSFQTFFFIMLGLAVGTLGGYILKDLEDDG